MISNKRQNAEHLRDNKGDCREANCNVCHLKSRCDGMTNRDIARAAQDFLDEDSDSFQGREEMLDILSKKLQREGKLGRDERLSITRR